jgi:hypothetical protein
MEFFSIRALIAIVHALLRLEIYASDVEVIKSRAFRQLLHWRMHLSWRGRIIVALATANIERSARPILGKDIQAYCTLSFTARC